MCRVADHIQGVWKRVCKVAGQIKGLWKGVCKVDQDEGVGCCMEKKDGMAAWNGMWLHKEGEC